ncbi:hypothetical protein Tco_0559328 [Tanacetum coccineum]
MLIHPRHSNSDGDAVKITIVGSSTNSGPSKNFSLSSTRPSDIHTVKERSIVISIQILKIVTNNFSKDNNQNTMVIYPCHSNSDGFLGVTYLFTERIYYAWIVRIIDQM